MGERQFSFRITTEKNIDREAQVYNETPYLMSFFPSGEGEIIGQTYENAEKHLQNLGFKVVKTPKQNIDNQTAGTVAGHNGEPGKEYDKGTTITLYVWEEAETSTLASEEPTEDPTLLIPDDSSDVLSDILDNNPFVW